MGNRLRRTDQSTRDYLGGPGIGLFALLLAFFFVVPGIGKMAGLDAYGIAIVFAALAVCIIATGRLRRRLRKEP
ncbi:MAG: hypothetical protein ACOH2Q_24930 [Rhodococcus sp. (in: high G+C Gram-positive bacteria)]